MKPLFNELIDAVYKFFKDLDDPHLNALLADWPSDVSMSRSVVAGNLPVLSWMSGVLPAAHEKAKHILKMLASVANQIAWGQTYSVEDFGNRFLERYGWTELIGLRGPIACDRIASGFLMLGPDIEYPKHSHEAEEVYVPLTGPTFWRRGNDDWEMRSPCRPIHHAPRVPHAMRTKSTPLLALYLWRGGNLTEKSKIE
jgi:hypothetical protein